MNIVLVETRVFLLILTFRSGPYFISQNFTFSSSFLQKTHLIPFDSNLLNSYFIIVEIQPIFNGTKTQTN